MKLINTIIPQSFTRKMWLLLRQRARATHLQTNSSKTRHTIWALAYPTNELNEWIAKYHQIPQRLTSTEKAAWGCKLNVRQPWRAQQPIHRRNLHRRQMGIDRPIQEPQRSSSTTSPEGVPSDGSTLLHQHCWTQCHRHCQCCIHGCCQSFIYRNKHWRYRCEFQMELCHRRRLRPSRLSWPVRERHKRCDHLQQPIFRCLWCYECWWFLLHHPPPRTRPCDGPGSPSQWRWSLEFFPL